MFIFLTSYSYLFYNNLGVKNDHILNIAKKISIYYKILIMINLQWVIWRVRFPIFWIKNLFNWKDWLVEKSNSKYQGRK